MNKESAVLDRELERDTHYERADRTAGRVSSNASAQPGAPAQPSASKRSFGDRIKGALSNMLKALEGDHESHYYRS